MSFQNNFIISRVFEAPKDVVFRAWTDSTEIIQWWGPPGVTNTVSVMDVRSGGAYRIVMHYKGEEYPVKGIYREVRKPDCIVMTMDCAEHPSQWHDQVKPNRGRDENNPVGIMLATVTFEGQNNKTKLTIKINFRSAYVREAMLKMGMNEEWALSLERLANLLAKEKSREAVY